MKKNIVICLIIFLAPLIGSSKDLAIEMELEKKYVYIESGDEIKVVTKDQEIYKGKVQINNSRQIRINEKTIKIDQIGFIKTIKRSERKISKIIGLSVLGAGGVAALSGAIYSGLSNELDPVLVGGFTGICCTIAAAPFLHYWRKGSERKKFDTNEGWKFKIVDLDKYEE